MADEVGTPTDYFQAWAFVLEIEGIAVAGFTSFGPLKQDVKLIAQEEGGARTTVDETTGKFMTDKCTGERGASFNDELWSWWLNVKAGVKDKRQCSVVGQAPDGTPLVRWNLKDCNLVSYEGGSYDAKKDENLVEKIEIKPIDIDRVAA